MQIRRMTGQDLESAVAVCASNNWGDMRAAFAFHAGHPDCHSFVAESHGSVVATGVGTCRGATGWVGQISVLPEYRGQGMGTAMTRHIMDRLLQLGCETLLLIATEMGRPIYTKLGFVMDSDLVFLKGPTRAEPPNCAPALRPLLPGDLAAICSLDRQATGENRRAQLEACLPIGGWIVPDGGAFWLQTPWGGGPIVATDPAVGCALLDFLRGKAGELGVAETTHALPAGNAVAIGHLTASGYRETSRLARMVWGKPLRWSPPMLFGRFNGALG